MNVAILHYHLNHGGVTQVIANQLRALDQVCARSDGLRVALLSDGQTAGWPADLGARLTTVELAMRVVPGLRYDERPESDAQRLAEELLAQFSALGWRPDETILHVHNHSLGKNASLPGALRRLADRGFALLLQIHDFAEDCRPKNYRHLAAAWQAVDLAPTLYPQAAHVHYAVLNRRDHDLLARAGVPADRLHYLPNPSEPRGRPADRSAARAQLCARFGVPRDARFLLYPVRAIRRKNIGEALLWSVLGGPGTHLGVTLAPLNPAEQACYRHWKELARELRLPVHFEIGGSGGLPLDLNMAAADLVLTTSVTEGFGMVFLESWLADRMLVGRDLPEITRDFRAAGLQLACVSHKLSIPLELVGRDAFLDALMAGCAAQRRAYGRPAVDDASLAAAVLARTADDTVDFGDLDPRWQTRILRRATSDAGLRDDLVRLNPFVVRAWDLPRYERQSLIAWNRCVVREEYSLAASGARLWHAYRRTSASPRGARITALPHTDRVLDEFLVPDRFRPLRG